MLDSKKDKPLSNNVSDIKPKDNSFFVFIRSIAWMYSFYVKIRMFIARNIHTRARKQVFKQKKDLFILSEEEKNRVLDLQTYGITVIEDYFDDSLIDEIAEKANTMLHNLDITEQLDLINMNYDEVSIAARRIFVKDPLINIPKFVNIAFDESILKIISTYFGYIPTHFSTVDRAFPKNPLMGTSFFHKDSLTVGVINVFIYLNDVCEDGGPFCYIPKSHNHTIKSCRPRTNSDMGKEGYQGRIYDDEMTKHYPPELWTPIRGKKGTMIIVDTDGLHKGPCWSDKPITEQYNRDMLGIHCRGKDTFQPDECELIPEKSVQSFSELQKLFLSEYSVV